MWVVRAALGAPRRALLVAVLALVAAAFAASQLQSGSPERLLAGAHSRVGAATQGQEQRFGGEPIVVDLRGELETTLAPQNLTTLLGLEQRLRKLPGVQTVIGPASFVDQAAAQMQAVVARELGPPAQRAEVAARSAVARARADGVRGKQLAEIDAAARLQSLGPQLRQQYQELFVRFGYVGIPSLSNANFVLQLVKGASLTPKKRFGWLFPSNRHALVLIRPRAGLDDARVRALGTQVSRLVAGTRLEGVTTNVAGAPLVVAAASASFAHDLLELAPFVLAAMLLALLLGLGLRARAVHLLLPAGGAALLTAGLSWPLGLGFTPATLAALPVVVGLALDYAVQLQARYWARRSAGVAPRDAAEQAVAQIGPTLLLAGGAMIAGFLVLVASPVPLVDRLAITLALGVAVSLVFVLVLGGPLLVARDRPGITAPRLSLPDLRVPYHVRMAALGIALGITVAGVALSAGTHVESDLRKLAGSDLPALKRLERLQHDLGTSGQLRVAVKARDVTDPAVLAWMARVEPKILALDPGLRPGPNLAAILQAGGGDTLPDRAAVQRLLGLIPPAFVSAVLARDHRRAELSFGVPLRSARDQAALIERMQRLLETAPAGVDAQAAGLLAMSAAGVSGLQDGRPWLLLLAAALVFALLYAARRRVDRALIPLLPALLAAAATTVAERALGFALSPLSATLDPLVLGVGVEFGLLLEARYHEERATAAPAAAARIAAERLGAPVAVAAGTVALGFAVLAFSALPALRQFGLVAAGELVLCVVAAIALVPALCAAADRRRTLRVSAPCGHAVAGTVRS
jgi:predicted RND superfamily exporter protein